MSLSKGQKIYYALRIASAMCFMGHGAFGIITKEIWCNYFAVFGISHDLAFELMPVVGLMDITFGLIILFCPVRLAFVWLVIWGTITASLRPLSGEPFAEFIERAGNFGAPLCLLLLTSAPGYGSGWFKMVHAPLTTDRARLKMVQTALQIAGFLLLTGHAWLNLTGKKSLLGQYASLGFSHPHQTALIVGLAELAIGLLILTKPVRPLILVFLIWKISSELFYPHYELWEWIERGGSYGVLLALFLALPSAVKTPNQRFSTAIQVPGL